MANKRYDIQEKTEVKREGLPPLSLNPYFLGEKLELAVDMAIALERPLLLQGDPGCGKTRLAQAVALALHGKDGFRDNYFEWYIKSSSKVSDGVYSFDHIRRLRDAQLEREKISEKQSDNLFGYLDFGPLAKAFKEAKKDKKPPVLLIDEIDKADIDFPNDLLLELDQKRFEIPELLNSKDLEFQKEGRIFAEVSPIIIITSNNEKDLPAAFLRRCLFHYVDFPTKEDLTEIVLANFHDFDSKLLEIALSKFEQLRGDMQNQSDKRVSTGELLDWLILLKHFNIPIEELKKKGFPLHQALLKTQSDLISHHTSKLE